MTSNENFYQWLVSKDSSGSSIDFKTVVSVSPWWRNKVNQDVGNTDFSHKWHISDNSAKHDRGLATTCPKFFLILEN